MLNAYYEADYKAARAHGIRTGTYHFFSTMSPGAAQAAYFLKCSKFNKGDLPPVLDVEPTDAQIVAMGGAKVMFRNIRAWMSLVQKRTGKRPILISVRLLPILTCHWHPIWAITITFG